MGIEPDIWYKAQGAYLKNALKYLEFNKSIVLTKIWLNITKLGCSYCEEIENECWGYCPSILKDEHLGVFKKPKFL